MDHGSKITCGAPQVVTYVRGPGHIAYVPAPLLTCGMALALASYEKILQEEAERVFQAPIVRMDQIGTYNCRGIVRFKGVVSEPRTPTRSTSRASRSRTARVSRCWATSISATGRRPVRRGFLRAVSQRGQDEDVFSNVLTPFWDAAHKNHFHLDLARYRVEGVRPIAR